MNKAQTYIRYQKWLFSMLGLFLMVLSSSLFGTIHPENSKASSAIFSETSSHKNACFAIQNSHHQTLNYAPNTPQQLEEEEETEDDDFGTSGTGIIKAYNTLFAYKTAHIRQQKPSCYTGHLPLKHHPFYQLFCCWKHHFLG
jgi:hypothetical protein